MNHVLREFRTHLSWFGVSTSSSLSIRYFYIPRSQYGKSKDFVSSNIISCSTDPLQLEHKSDDSSTNNLMFYEWKISDNNSVSYPPPASCVLIVVSSLKKIKEKHKQHQIQNRDNECSDSYSDDGLVLPEDEEKTNYDEGILLF